MSNRRETSRYEKNFMEWALRSCGQKSLQNWIMIQISIVNVSFMIRWCRKLSFLASLGHFCIFKPFLTFIAQKRGLAIFMKRVPLDSFSDRTVKNWCSQGKIGFQRYAPLTLSYVWWSRAFTSPNLWPPYFWSILGSFYTSNIGVSSK